jgi:hypothetical protein
MTWKNELLDSSSQVTTAMRPPGLSTRWASPIARRGSGQNINPYAFVTASMDASSIASASASIVRHSMLSRPAAAAAEEVTAIISGAMSDATTDPPGRTRAAAASAG